MQLGLGLVLRRLRALLPEDWWWHAIDCSVSGISGHGDKVDYGFFEENGKFFTQVLTMVEVKNVFASSEAVKAEATGQLVARGEVVFRKQPGRTHVAVAAVARDSVDVMVVHADGRVWHTGHHSFSMGEVSEGLLWLLRLLLATPAGVGFRSTVPPVIPVLSPGSTIRDMRLVDYDSGPAAVETDLANTVPAVRPTRVYKAKAVSATWEEAVAVKVGPLLQINKEVSASQFCSTLEAQTRSLLCLYQLVLLSATLCGACARTQSSVVVWGFVESAVKANGATIRHYCSACRQRTCRRCRPW